jgi:hypothetical protein
MNPPDFPEFQQLLLVKEIKMVDQQEMTNRSMSHKNSHDYN